MKLRKPFNFVIFRKIFEMFKNIMIVLLSVAASGTLSAQANRQLRNNGMSAATGNFFSEMRKKKDAQSSITETVGTPYIEESFKPCEVYYGDELVGKFFYLPPIILERSFWGDHFVFSLETKHTIIPSVIGAYCQTCETFVSQVRATVTAQCVADTHTTRLLSPNVVSRVVEGYRATH